MRRTAAEKYELIRLVEGSELPVRQTLRELRPTRSTFYRWYHRYRQHGRPRPVGTGTGFHCRCGSGLSTPRWRIPSDLRGNWHGG